MVQLNERLGVFLVVLGIVLCVVGVVARGYYVYSYTSEGYLSGVSYPLSLVGVVLIVISLVLLVVGFYGIVKDRIKG